MALQLRQFDLMARIASEQNNTMFLFPVQLLSFLENIGQNNKVIPELKQAEIELKNRQAEVKPEQAEVSENIGLDEQRYAIGPEERAINHRRIEKEIRNSLKG